jgi:hypothetical protein
MDALLCGQIFGALPTHELPIPDTGTPDGSVFDGQNDQANARYILRENNSNFLLESIPD